MVKLEQPTEFSSACAFSARDLYEEILTLPAISTHEHLWDESWRLKQEHDWTDIFFHYGITALKSAGLTDRDAEVLFAKTTAHEKKWALLESFT